MRRRQMAARELGEAPAAQGRAYAGRPRTAFGRNFYDRGRRPHGTGWSSRPVEDPCTDPRKPMTLAYVDAAHRGARIWTGGLVMGGVTQRTRWRLKRGQGGKLGYLPDTLQNDWGKCVLKSSQDHVGRPRKNVRLVSLRWSPDCATGWYTLRGLVGPGELDLYKPAAKGQGRHRRLEEGDAAEPHGGSRRKTVCFGLRIRGWPSGTSAHEQSSVAHRENRRPVRLSTSRPRPAKPWRCAWAPPRVRRGAWAWGNLRYSSNFATAVRLLFPASA